MPKPIILIIDYEPRSIAAMSKPLSEAGFHIEVAGDGISGIKAFESHQPVLVLIEAMLPKKHGFEVCQELKKSSHGQRTPVIVTTAVYRGRKYRTQAMHIHGADEYLEKPFTEERLLETVRRFVESPAKAETEEAAGSDASSEPGSDADGDDSGKTDDEDSGKSGGMFASIVGNLTEEEITAQIDAMLPGEEDATFGAVFGDDTGATDVPAGDRPPEDEPVETVTDEPGEVAADEPGEVAADEPVEAVADEPVEVAADEPVEVAADEPVEVVADEPVEVVADEPVEVAADEPVEVDALPELEKALEDDSRDRTEEGAVLETTETETDESPRDDPVGTDALAGDAPHDPHGDGVEDDATEDGAGRAGDEADSPVVPFDAKRRKRGRKRGRKRKKGRKGGADDGAVAATPPRGTAVPVSHPLPLAEDAPEPETAADPAAGLEPAPEARPEVAAESTEGAAVATGGGDVAEPFEASASTAHGTSPAPARSGSRLWLGLAALVVGGAAVGVFFVMGRGPGEPQRASVPDAPIAATDLAGGSTSGTAPDAANEVDETTSGEPTEVAGFAAGDAPGLGSDRPGPPPSRATVPDRGAPAATPKADPPATEEPKAEGPTVDKPKAEEPETVPPQPVTPEPNAAVDTLRVPAVTRDAGPAAPDATTAAPRMTEDRPAATDPVPAEDEAGRPSPTADAAEPDATTNPARPGNVAETVPERTVAGPPSTPPAKLPGPRAVEPAPATPPAAAVREPETRPVPEPKAPEPEAARGDLVLLHEADRAPEVVNRIVPSYPTSARRMRQEGTVVLNVLIDETGKVADVEIILGVTSDLDQAAVNAVRAWTYTPAEKDGVPVKVWKPEKVAFKL